MQLWTQDLPCPDWVNLIELVGKTHTTPWPPKSEIQPRY